MGEKSKEMTEEHKQLIAKLNGENLSKAEIGRIVGYSRCTISKFLKNVHARGIININKPRSGRPKSTSKNGNRILMRLVKSDRRRSLDNLCSAFNSSVPRPVSRQTIQRRLSSEGYQDELLLIN
jgi:transposase